MARYTKKDADGRYYIESVNGKLESDKFGHTYGESIDRFAELENADVAPKGEVEALLKENERWMTEYANYREGVREAIKEIKIGFAREIFAEIEKMLENQEVVAKNPREKELGDWIFHNYIPIKITKLKKKYTEENE